MKLLRSSAVGAICKRQFWSLMGNPIGYVFILAFVLISAGVLFVPDAFFVRNIDDLGLLESVMPWLLAVLIPAIAMGSWASERELGTHEQVLTLPLSETDAVLGKWMAVASYFTLALVCSLSNVVVLVWLGEPDIGLVISQYLGWWFLGLVYAAASVTASVCVGLPAIAFVLGGLVCAGLCVVTGEAAWLDPFYRGIVSLGQIGVALSATVFFLGLSVLVLASQRWQRQRRGIVIASVLTFVGLTVTAFNLSVQVDRAAVDWDVTEEGLSSLSGMSRELLEEQSVPVKLTVFVSQELPPELELKGTEVLNLVNLLEREVPGKVSVKLYRPEDSLSGSGAMATEHYGVTPRRVLVDAVTGKEEREVFLGAVVTSGPRSEVISYFDPGVSVEYELLRAIKAAATAKKKVVGIAKTELKMVGGLDYQARQMRQPWQAVEEIKKQYEVRSVNLDVPIGDDVAVLIVPQMSGLTEKQFKTLHDAIWGGLPTLILEDPFPLFSGPQLGTSQPRTPPQQNFGRQPPQAPPKPDIKPLVEALGVSYEADKVLWSDFNPSHQFRNVWPRHLVWTFRSKGGIPSAPVVSGIDSLLFPWPGGLRIKSDLGPELKVTPLAGQIPRVLWGAHGYDELIARSFLGTQLRQPERHTPGQGEPPWLAVQVKGKMKRVFAGADAEKDKVGALSAKPVHVILIADTDFAHDEFFNFYRNSNNSFSDDALAFLKSLRNVQLFANAIDALVGDDGFVELRSRRPKARPLAAVVDVLEDAQKAYRAAEINAQDAAQKQIEALQKDFKDKLAAIEKKPGLDENAKRQLVAQVRASAQRRVDRDTQGIERKRDLAIRAANIQRQKEVEKVRGQVRTMALGIPSALLAVLALGVWVGRRRKERLTIPASRRRSS